MLGAIESSCVCANSLTWPASQINSRRIRLHGIDAPEIDQTCRKGSGQVYRCGEHCMASCLGFRTTLNSYQWTLTSTISRKLERQARFACKATVLAEAVR